MATLKETPSEKDRFRKKIHNCVVSAVYRHRSLTFLEIEQQWFEDHDMKILLHEAMAKAEYRDLYDFAAHNTDELKVINGYSGACIVPGPRPNELIMSNIQLIRGTQAMKKPNPYHSEKGIHSRAIQRKLGARLTVPHHATPATATATAASSSASTSASTAFGMYHHDSANAASRLLSGKTTNYAPNRFSRTSVAGSKPAVVPQSAPKVPIKCLNSVAPISAVPSVSTMSISRPKFGTVQSTTTTCTFGTVQHRVRSGLSGLEETAVGGRAAADVVPQQTSRLVSSEVPRVQPAAFRMIGGHLGRQMISDSDGDVPPANPRRCSSGDYIMHDDRLGESSYSEVVEPMSSNSFLRSAGQSAVRAVPGGGDAAGIRPALITSAVDRFNASRLTAARTCAPAPSQPSKFAINPLTKESPRMTVTLGTRTSERSISVAGDTSAAAPRDFTARAQPSSDSFVTAVAYEKRSESAMSDFGSFVNTGRPRFGMKNNIAGTTQTGSISQAGGSVKPAILLNPEEVAEHEDYLTETDELSIPAAKSFTSGTSGPVNPSILMSKEKASFYAEDDSDDDQAAIAAPNAKTIKPTYNYVKARAVVMSQKEAEEYGFYDKDWETDSDAEPDNFGVPNKTVSSAASTTSTIPTTLRKLDIADGVTGTRSVVSPGGGGSQIVIDHGSMDPLKIREAIDKTLEARPKSAVPSPQKHYSNRYASPIVTRSAVPVTQSTSVRATREIPPVTAAPTVPMAVWSSVSGAMRKSVLEFNEFLSQHVAGVPPPPPVMVKEAVPLVKENCPIVKMAAKPAIASVGVQADLDVEDKGSMTPHAWRETAKSVSQTYVGRLLYYQARKTAFALLAHDGHVGRGVERSTGDGGLLNKSC
ncbi:hypothetical protein BV898_05145 [Hypsibius exemplaris]|uniref:Uncharacterized protein n=1 Tax=Hypsibius exemplaris TaxID=2072580 RepID=A0A1W0X021_HYPEX|nr:hypothetical protein BV898_05145 [Hypsibius exemplaris]